MFSVQFFVFASFVMILDVYAQTCASNRHSDGCSIPYDLPYLYKRRFTTSCNKHDICYYCAAHCGHAQYYCDRKFLQDMRNACSSLPWVTRQHCRQIALNYYMAVRIRGRRHFVKRSPNWCRQRWTRPCC